MELHLNIEYVLHFAHEKGLGKYLFEGTRIEQVQIMDEAVSNHANALEKSINPSVLSPAMGK